MKGKTKCQRPVYQGVEYVYSGGVDHDTMEAFLDTLE